jgi:hypothetical protein
MNILGNLRELASNAYNKFGGMFNQSQQKEQPKYYSNRQIFEPKNPDEFKAQENLIRKNQVANAFEPFVYNKFGNDKLLEGDIDKRYQRYINRNFNLADTTKNAMQNNISYNFTGEIGKNYGGMYYGQPTENKFTKMSQMPNGVVEIPNNQLNYYPANVGMHETIHAMNNLAGLEGNRQIASQINNQWQNNRNRNQVKYVDNQINQYPELYGKAGANEIADERLAYLGMNGLRGIPPELLKYFLSIFKQ